MTVHVAPVAGRRDLQRFLDLPARLHHDHVGWVPLLRADERRTFTPGRNLAMRYCDHALWLARDARGVVVGRIGGVINHRYNRLRDEATARFTHLECIDDVAVADALLERVTAWARAGGMSRVVGPMGFTDQDPEGLMVEGFDEEPSIATYHNRPETVRLLERLGWAREVDYVVYRVPVAPEVPASYSRILDRVAGRGRLRLVEFGSRRNLRPWIRPILGLMNETFAANAGYAPLDEREIRDLGRRYLPIIDPRFVKAVVADSEPVGFIVAIPSIVAGIRRARGRLLPLGWLHILRARRSADRLDLLLGGIRDRYRARGVDVLLGAAMIRAARNAGFRYMDSHHELESNARVRAEMEAAGGRIYKRYRVFRRDV